MQPLAQPPRKDDRSFDDWMYRLWKRIASTGGLSWLLIDKTGSNLTDIETRNHADLQNINTASYTHLTATDHTDLTDGGATTLHKHSHNSQDGLQGGTALEYYHLTNVQNSLIPSGTPTAGQIPVASSGTASAWGNNTAYALKSATTVIDVSAATAPTAGQVLTATAGTTATWQTPTTGTVTSVSVVSANGFAGTSSGGATPALTLSTSIIGMLKGNGTAISAATAGTDYSLGTSSLTTGILKSTTTTGALTIAVAADFPTLNQDTTGTAAKVADGDKGDLTVSGAGTVWTIDNGVVTYSKIQNISTTDKILGRVTAGAGSIEEIACTAAGRALIDDIDAAAQRTTLGLVIGTNVQAYDADLTTWAGITPAAGISTFLSTPTSANFRSAITDETGYGALVFNTSPTLVTPILGTPTSGNLANCTFPTLNQNTTGTAANVTGTVDIANGGTGQITAQAAINALSAVSAATNEHVLTKDTATGNAIWKASSGGVATVSNTISSSTTIAADTSYIVSSYLTVTSDLTVNGNLMVIG